MNKISIGINLIKKVTQRRVIIFDEPMYELNFKLDTIK